MDLHEKVAVIAGASGGIGKEFSKALAKNGAHVFLVARNENVLEPLKREIEESGGKANVYLADITDEHSVSGLVRFVEKEVGHVDILVNAAGIGVYKKFPEVTYEDWKRQMAINLDAVFLVIRGFLPLLQKSREAYVINMGSGMGKLAVAGRSPYCTSKFALRGLIQSLAKEYKKTHINFILLTLGSVLTSFGPLTKEDKIAKSKAGKGYLDPSWLAEHVVTKLRNETLKPETPVYPKHYFEESKKGKT